MTLSLLCALCATARAQTDADALAPHARGHLFLRGQLGLGHSRSEIGGAGYHLDARGIGHAATVSVGLTVLDGVALYLGLSQHGIRKPRITVRQERTVRDQADFDLFAHGVGLGVTQYFSTYNLFWDATVGLGDLTFIEGSSWEATDVGPAGRIGFGREWWLAPRFGLGLTAQLHLLRARNPTPLPGGDHGAFFTRTIVLGVTATYN